MLIFPDLASANIACKFAAKVGGGESDRTDPDGHEPARCMSCNAPPTVEEVVNVAAIAVVDAQENDTYAHPHVHVPVEPELIGED